jgi:hypothetical protein
MLRPERFSRSHPQHSYEGETPLIYTRPGKATNHASSDDEVLNDCTHS